MPAFLVTGCDSGFGKLVSEFLDQQGHTVFSGCLTQKGCDELSKACSKNVHPLLLDITSSESLKAAEVHVSNTLGGAGLDGLLNNAGVLVTPGPL
jgi:NAD(P)-dependent dehydrogenase (short-subunit alcohol dehydrogenase family)